ncbi:uncharacterized protein IWZ02DRAFT_283920 [Phyllosticta citriasiana]|uniref:uncharacterized protein n=1 Tax=Phyllosticta citriasiana TaxID=595635 RepID=UPI0030FD2840
MCMSGIVFPLLPISPIMTCMNPQGCVSWSKGRRLSQHPSPAVSNNQSSDPGSEYLPRSKSLDETHVPSRATSKLMRIKTESSQLGLDDRRLAAVGQHRLELGAHVFAEGKGLCGLELKLFVAAKDVDKLLVWAAPKRHLRAEVSERIGEFLRGRGHGGECFLEATSDGFRFQKGGSDQTCE